MHALLVLVREEEEKMQSEEEDGVERKRKNIYYVKTPSTVRGTFYPWFLADMTVMETVHGFQH
jgi:hypothetical protein